MGKDPGVLHLKCGKRYPNGDRTGHCAKCCESFFGSGAFDRHFYYDDAGEFTCRDMGTLGAPWRLDTEGRWRHGEEMDAEAKARLRPDGDPEDD